MEFKDLVVGDNGVGMELVIKPFHSLPCRLEVFTINGMGADHLGWF